MGLCEECERLVSGAVCELMMVVMLLSLPEFNGQQAS